MALVVRNNAKSLVPVAKNLAMVAGVTVGQRVVRNGRDYFWNGLNWLGRTAWNRYNNNAPIPRDVTIAPVATSRRVRGFRPKFTTSKGFVKIRHREYITQVNGVSNGSFLLNRGLGPGAFAVNLLNVNIFPWMNSIARNFDQYRLSSVSFHYIPMCATSEIGRVGLFWDRDSGDTGPDDRAELAHFQHLTESAPWAPQELVAPTDNQFRFINDTGVIDRKLIDFGRFGLSLIHI